MRKEGGPALDSVRGKDEESKKKVEELISERHADQDVAYEGTPFIVGMRRKQEREKTPEERQMIAMANTVTDKIRQRYGLDAHPVPEENILMTELHPFWATHLAAYSPERQSIDLSSGVSENKLAKTHVLVHEMIHMKSYNALGAKETPSGEVKSDVQRIGLVTQDLESGGFMLIALNEAVTERLARKAMREIETDPLFAPELAERKRLEEEHPDKVPDEAIGAWEEKGLFGKKIMHDGDIYEDAVSALDLLVEKLHDQFPNDFASREDVFDLFGKAAMTGKMLVLGRVMKKAFGEDALRKIAEAGGDGKKLKKIVESL